MVLSHTHYEPEIEYRYQYGTGRKFLDTPVNLRQVPQEVLPVVLQSTCTIYEYINIYILNIVHAVYYFKVS